MKLQIFSRFLNSAAGACFLFYFFEAKNNKYLLISVVVLICLAVIVYYFIFWINKKLICAAENGDHSSVEWCLKLCADVNVRCKNSINTCQNISKYSLEKISCNCGGGTPLIRASRSGHLDIVNYLLENGAEVNAQDNICDTAVAWAGFNHHNDILELLINYGADINSFNINGDTVLIETVRRGNLEGTKLLIEHNCDINKKNSAGISAIMFAVSYNYVDIIRLLVSAKADCDAALLLAVVKGMRETTQLLLDNNAYVNYACPQTGETAFIIAAKIGNIELANLLLLKGADINARTKDGFTPLMCAAKEGYLDMIKFLINQKNIDRLILNKNGKSAYDLAINESVKNILENYMFDRSEKYKQIIA